MNKIVKRIIIVILIILFLLYVIYPMTFGLIATFKFNKKVGLTPEGFTDVSLETSDHITLKGWYKKPQNGVVIIVVHGSTASRDEVRKHIKFLTENGYGVLAFDMRGHGESNGDGAVAYNWDGTKDVRAAINYLLKEEVKTIGALGLSLGAEVLLTSASDSPEIKAIVSEGATQHSTKDYVAIKENKSFLRSYSTRLMYLTVKLFSGRKEPISISESISKAKDTSFLFIAGGNMKEEITFNKYYNNLVKDRSELWIINNCNHTKGISKEYDNYVSKVINFYNEYLINKI